MDTSETTPSWNDVYTPEELAAALDLQAAKLAKRHGYYEIANELNHAAECIRDLAEQQAALASELAVFVGAAMDGIESLNRVKQQIASGIESLSKVPQP